MCAQSIIAFSTGMQLVSSKIAKKFVIVAIVIFSIMAPLGIGIGFLITKFTSIEHAAKGRDRKRDGMAS